MRNEEAANPNPIPVSCGGATEGGLRKTVEGPNGIAEVYEVVIDLPPDPWASEGLALARVMEVVYEVRFQGQGRGSYPEEEEAAAVAAELAGIPF